MTDNIVAVDFNGVKVLLDSNTALITLKGVSTLNNTVTMKDIRDATQYQVPTGKKAKVIYITTMDAAQELIYADDLDGTTNSVELLDPDTNMSNKIIISAEIPADKYLNITGGAASSYEVTIVEESAT